VAELFGEFGSKVAVPIRYNLFGNAIMGENVSAVQFGYPCDIYLFVTGKEDHCFGTIVIGDSEDSVIPSTRWQFSDEIKGYSFKGGCSRFWSDRIQGRLWLYSEGFGCLTHATSFHIFGDVVSDGWPPVIPGNRKHGFRDSGVSCGSEVMVEGNYPPSKAIMFHHDETGTKGPSTIGEGETVSGGESWEVSK
jgi:hypothetical protein